MASITASLSSTSINSVASTNSSSTSASTGSSSARADKSAFAFLTDHNKVEPRTPTPTKYAADDSANGSVDSIPSIVNHNNNHIYHHPGSSSGLRDGDEESLIKPDDVVIVANGSTDDVSSTSMTRGESDSFSSSATMSSSTPSSSSTSSSSRIERKFSPAFELRRPDVRERPSRPTSVKMFQFHVTTTPASPVPGSALAQKPLERKSSTASSFRSKLTNDDVNLLKQMKSKSAVFEDLAQGLFAPIVNQEEVGWLTGDKWGGERGSVRQVDMGITRHSRWSFFHT